MSWNGLHLTKEGRKALTKAQVDNKVVFYSIVVGDGNPPANFDSVTALVNQLFEITELEIELTEKGCILTGDFPKLNKDYYFREIGVMVKTNEGNKLYVYDNCGSDAEHIVVSTGAESTEKRVRLELIFSDVANITVEVPSVLYATHKELTDIGNLKVDKEPGKILTSNDFSNIYKSKVDSIDGINQTVNDHGQTIEILRSHMTTIDNNLENKVDKEYGKVLSSNDYTNAEKAAVARATIGLDDVNSAISILRAALTEKVNINRGDVANTIVSTLSSVTDNFPIPSAGDKTSTVIGKIVKFFGDIKTWMGKVVLKSHIVDNTTSTRSDLPLSAKQGKVMMDQINNLNNATGAKTYSAFTAKPSAWLGKGSPFAMVGINNNFAYAPPTRAGTKAWYNTITIGTSTRCTQIAIYGFSSATVDQGSIFFRRQHDNDVSGWSKVF